MGKSVCTRLQRRPAVATSGGGNAMSENISDKPERRGPVRGPPELPEDRKPARRRRRGRRRNARQVRPRAGHAGASADRRRGAGEMVAVEMGRHRRGRRLEPHHARQGARCGQMDPRRQDLQDRPHLRAGHAAVRRARLHAAHSRRPDRRPVRRRTSWSITTNISRPRSARSAPSSTASAISASSSARTATRARCISTTASRPPRSATPTA